MELLVDILADNIVTLWIKLPSSHVNCDSRETQPISVTIKFISENTVRWLRLRCVATIVLLDLPVNWGAVATAGVYDGSDQHVGGKPERWAAVAVRFRG